MLDRQLWVGTQKKQTNKQSKEGGGLERMREILSIATFTQIPNHKKTRGKKNKNDITKKYSKLKQGKLRGITKCLQVDIYLTRAI